MKPVARIYAVLISLIGFLVGVYCVYYKIIQLSTVGDLKSELIELFVLFSLAFLCRCLPIYIRPDFSIDMAFISNFAILLCKGPIVAAAITIISSPFIVVPGPAPEKKLSHIFNTDPIKTAFNTANFTLSVFLGGMAFIYAGGTVGDLSFPGVLLPSAAMILTIIIVNSIVLLLLFKLNSGIPFFGSLIKNLLEFMPSVIAAAPIGYFIAKFMTMKDGAYLVIMFILPLMFARYAFSLYIDVKHNYFVMLKTLTYSIEAKDEYTRGHSERVEEYVKIIAKEMRYSYSQIEDISVAALLHDVGKIGIDESILTKPTSLTPEEREIIMKHPQISVQILKEVKLRPIVFEMILHHHEKYDGTGYPSGLSGEELPIEVFVLSVADTYDAITSTRPYSPGLSAEMAKQLILQEKGKQFHPKVVDAFIRAYDKGNMTVLVRNYEGRELAY
ncbi:MAG: HD-GYP domain-containing protein [Clostridia bacterium]|nr:HD-GYP domain-containing protein [Clostridia bacterium]